MRNTTFPELLSHSDVIIMKHCYPASDVLEDIGDANPLSDRKSIENYKAIYRALRDRFDCHPDTLFIIWTLPPLHRLYDPREGNKYENAARATLFSDWLQTDFLTEKGPHRNIKVWDFRGLVMDRDTNFLKNEYERKPDSPDSHPNEDANKTTGPIFARFICDAVRDFDIFTAGPKRKIRGIYLHHSTGGNVYKYARPAIQQCAARRDGQDEARIEISDAWYPASGNMPADYYHIWLKDPLDYQQAKGAC